MTAITPRNPREERRQLHQELSRSQLLDAAEEIFGQKGFHETTLKEIADRADFSVGSVYSFFENKDDLYVSVWLRRGSEFLPEFAAAIDGAADGLDAISRIVDFEVSFLRSRPSFSNLYLRTTGTLVPISNEGALEQVHENAAAVLQMQADVIAGGQADGSVRSGDPAALSRILSGMVQAFQTVDAEMSGSSASNMSLEELHSMVRSAFTAER